MASLTLDWLHTIFLLGAVQGLFLTVALASKRHNRTANRLLAAAMLSFSIGLATSVYHGAGLERALPHFFGVGYPMPFLYGPLVFLYALAAADRDYRLTRLDAAHFMPFMAVVVAAIPVYLLDGDAKLASFEQLKSGNPPLLVTIADPLKYVSGAGYTIATLAFLRRHRERVKDSYSSTERVNLEWLLWLATAAAAIWLLALVLTVLESLAILRPRPDDLVSLAVAALVYAIGYKGLRQPEVFRFETAEHPIPVATSATASAETETEAARYERSGLSDAEARRLKDTLVSVMDKDRPWKNSELTLADLADRLNTTPHKLSEVLNSQIGETFYDFVNGYRVREVQRRIAAGEGKVLKILSLALDAGFASKSTFNQVFKKHTSQTPSDFQQTAGA